MLFADTSLSGFVLVEGTGGTAFTSKLTDGLLVLDLTYVKSEEVELKLIGRPSPPLPRRSLELARPQFALYKIATGLI